MVQREQDVVDELRRAAALLDSDPDAAEAVYLDVLDRAADVDEAWFDLGLLYKRRRDWPRALECNMRAVELLGPRAGEPAWWNLGIAATALHDWDTARRAWRAYGIDLPAGTGPIEVDLGLSPVRLTGEGDDEVVWGQRIDPARIVIQSVPFPTSGHRCGDCVLHDGVPNGERETRGRVYPVFDELELWQQSGAPTLQVTLTVASQADVDELLEQTSRSGLAAEDWSANVRALCKECSEGRPHGHIEGAFDRGTDRWLGLAGNRADVLGLLAAWAERDSDRTYRVVDEDGAPL